MIWWGSSSSSSSRDESTSRFELKNDDTAIDIFFKKYGPIPASFSFIFVLFTSQINYKLKKRRWSAWDSNPGPQDGRRWRNHGAMAATSFYIRIFLWPILYGALLHSNNSAEESRWQELSYFSNQKLWLIGQWLCGSVGREVAYNTRGPRFDSSHRQLLLNIYLLLTVCRKDENKEKRPGMAHLLKLWLRIVEPLQKDQSNEMSSPGTARELHILRQDIQASNEFGRWNICSNNLYLREAQIHLNGPNSKK